VIRSAVLLAAGRGKRQRPYSDTTPKPLLPVHGRPTFDYVLTAVKRAGIERACIVTHHLEEQILDFVGDGSRWDLDVRFAHQDEIRGSGDALMAVPQQWIQKETFMVVATDYILEETVLRDLTEAHVHYQADMTMSLKECPIEELGTRSSVEVDSHWRLKRIVEKPTPEQVLSPYAASVMFIFPYQLWEYLPKIQPSPRGEIELQSAVQMMIDEGFKTYGLLQPAPLEWSASLHLTPGT
jgi:dTDP-glucose pyrophosphorylase